MFGFGNKRQGAREPGAPIVDERVQGAIRFAERRFDEVLAERDALQERVAQLEQLAKTQEVSLKSQQREAESIRADARVLVEQLNGAWWVEAGTAWSRLALRFGIERAFKGRVDIGPGIPYEDDAERGAC